MQELSERRKNDTLGGNTKDSTNYFHSKVNGMFHEFSKQTLFIFRPEFTALIAILLSKLYKQKAT